MEIVFAIRNRDDEIVHIGVANHPDRALARLAKGSLSHHSGLRVEILKSYITKDSAKAHLKNLRKLYEYNLKKAKGQKSS